MKFLSIAHSDVGIRKKINQDSVLIKEASTDKGNVLLALVCDGMGGFAKGEVASATLIRAFSEWFEKDLPDLLYKDGKIQEINEESLMSSWDKVISEVNLKIAAYGEKMRAQCGTTLAAILLANEKYYIANVGDSRVYKLDGTMKHLTVDQTFVQREIDEGRLTEDEAKVHPQRNVLLQCIGTGVAVVPEYVIGTFKPGEGFMLCSDGFRHVITEEEFLKLLSPEKLKSEKDLKDAAVYFTELNKQRRENDNISVLLIKVE